MPRALAKARAVSESDVFVQKQAEHPLSRARLKRPFCTLSL